VPLRVRRETIYIQILKDEVIYGQEQQTGNVETRTATRGHDVWTRISEVREAYIDEKGRAACVLN
jgi:hypothetical protein